MGTTTQTTTNDGTRATLAELVACHHDARDLAITPPRTARAPLAGGYRSAVHGRGIEFDEVRAYQPGDDVRTIDWRVTARAGRPYSKLFREERERSVVVLLDTGASMHFGTRRRFKSVAAARAAALVAWSAFDGGDRVGGLVLGERAVWMPPRRRQDHMARLLGAFATGTEAEPERATAKLADALAQLRRVTTAGSSVFVVSDFYGFGDEARAHLTAIARTSDVTCVLVYDRLEQSPPPPGLYRFTDGRHMVVHSADGEDWRSAYAAHFAARVKSLQDFCRKPHVSLILLRADADAAEPLRRAERVKRAVSRAGRAGRIR
jgi:uncharacterized protein (DUF58 family)